MEDRATQLSKEKGRAPCAERGPSRDPLDTDQSLEQNSMYDVLPLMETESGKGRKRM